MKKKLVYVCILSLLSMLFLAGCGNKEKKNNPNYNSDNYLSGTHYAVIDVQNYGSIYLELYADVAPATVTNFVNLTKDGFYDGLTFHRIISGFMIQGGDPAGNGTGNSSYTVPGEFAENKFENSLSHTRGTISMARADGDYDSASCQFFIVHETSKGLDGKYAAFGKVVSGMDVVDSICASAVVVDDNGTVLPKDQPVIQSIYIIDKDNVKYDSDKEASDDIVLPPPSAFINLFSLENVSNVPVAETWTIDENGQTFYITSSEDLLGIGLYKIDLSNGTEFNADNQLAYSGDFPANSFLSITVNLTEDNLTFLLVAEEHDGGIGRYLLGFDKNNNSAYLIPVL